MAAYCLYCRRAGEASFKNTGRQFDEEEMGALGHQIACERDQIERETGSRDKARGAIFGFGVDGTMERALSKKEGELAEDGRRRRLKMLRRSQ
ncbi:hypothetical protein HQ544_00340 [Candidatus Falkowbacteria bacterium]|nr:hypothetical protein [Candidatus Falkowbacteria bacterium]